MTVNFDPADSLQAYLAPNIDLPNPKDEPDLFYELINERERLTASIMNGKENATYTTVEIVTCQQWFSDAPSSSQQLQRQTFRKVINFGALPNAGPKPIPHGITVTAATTITRIYGAATNPAATDPNPRFIPLPYVDVTVEDQEIQLYATDTNVIVVTAFDATAFTTCYIILEYLQN